MPEQNPAIQLDSEEQALLSDYDAGKLSSVATPGVLQSLREAARATGHKDQRINILKRHQRAQKAHDTRVCINRVKGYPIPMLPIPQDQAFRLEAEFSH